MTKEEIYKLLQKQTYTCLSHRYGLVLCFGSVLLTLISAFQFGEVALEWSKVQYEVLFSIYSDNIVSKSFQERMCLPVPIDVVYTWVNGSDPQLLADLKRVKAQLEFKNDTLESHTTSGVYLDGNQTKEIKCKFKDCVVSNFLILDTTLPSNITLNHLKAENPVLQSAVRIYNISMVTESNRNYTVIQFPWKQSVSVTSGENLVISSQNVSVSRGFLTSDWTADHSVILEDTAMMLGLPKDIQESQVWDQLPMEYRDAVENIDLYEDHSLAVITIPDRDIFHKFMSQAEEIYQNTEEREIRVVTANLVWLLHHEDHQNEDISANRFEDNEELRYSLRSVERNAPWVRHIYIVTNGQIPSWLNLDNPRLTVITHEDIFTNKSHLPTFASPAIESHIHKIPGLSQKFIYLNDDVMFGKPVWPDDFYTHANGQKVYLTWPVPNCNEGCPSSWIKDGYCDKACNTSECEWDGGDCDGISADHAGGGWAADTSSMYCNSGCANGWVADRYCDQSCNVAECGFDAGDCGSQNFNKLYSVAIKKDTTHVILPSGLQVAFFNLTSIYGEGSITAGKYDHNNAIRTATVSNKFKTIHMLVYGGHNSTNVTIYVEGKNIQGEEIQVSFNVSVNTNPAKGAVVVNAEMLKIREQTKQNETNSSTKQKSDEDREELLIFDDIPEQQRAPKAKFLTDNTRLDLTEDLDEKLKSLPVEISWVITELREQVDKGDLTEKGFLKRKQRIVENYIKTGELPLIPKKREKVSNDDSERRLDRKENEVNFEEKAKSLEDDKVKLLDKLGGLKEEAMMQLGVGDGNVKEWKGEVQEKQIEGQIKEEKKEERKEDDDVVHLIDGQQKDENNNLVKIQEDMHVEMKGFERKIPIQIEDEMKNAEIEDDKTLKNKAADTANKEQDVKLPQNYENKVLKLNQSDPHEKEQENQHMRKSNEISQDDELRVKLRKLELNIESDGNQKLDGMNQDEKTINVTKKEMKAAMNNGKIIKGLQKIKMSNKNVKLMVNNSVDWQKRKLLTVDKQEMIEFMIGNEDILKQRSFLPWEKQDILRVITKKEQLPESKMTYITSKRVGRRLLDTFGDSLRHVNKLFNKKFGYAARKVPAHMPHMIDVEIMKELHDSFPEEFDKTSQHQVRHSADMQFAFSYMYFMMSQTKDQNVSHIFDEYDTDNSGALSDREIRTMATKIYDLPLDLQTLTGLEKMIKDCAELLPRDKVFEPPTSEQYYDKEMPLVTKYLVLHCEPLVELLNKTHQGQTKYKHEVMGDEEVAFKMIRTNVSHVIGQLDDIRRNPKKFICLNDNIEHNKKDAQVVKAVLQDFYESLFPIPSQFELPREYRNRFLQMEELNEWRRYRDWLKFWTHLSLACLIIFTLASFCSNQLLALKRKCCPERRPSHKTSATTKMLHV
ncbi:N-acetylglucosamine-1-phosphotransferase subunits alpha/beta-like isoform X2 [Ptychodera flava]